MNNEMPGRSGKARRAMSEQSEPMMKKNILKLTKTLLH